MIHALAKEVPDMIPAGPSGELLVMAFGGRRYDDTPYVVGDMVSGGAGASVHSDGVDSIDTLTSNSMNLPVEAMELEAPIRLHRCALSRDSGGAGRYRGGLGVEREYEILAGEVSFSHRGERHFTGAPGLARGGDGASAHSVIRRVDGREEEIHSKIVTKLYAGDRLFVVTAGGGGHGDPRERDRAAVVADVQNGKVSVEAARRLYGLSE
jgi:N-methylhydantoinase B/oxoprolinase/acetone carboxylase alpha subunit